MCHYEGPRNLGGKWNTSASDADDVNLLGDDIDTIKKNTEILIDASKEVGVEINTEKTSKIIIKIIAQRQ
jgi:hypothetical protein